jgi:c-di-GMP-binding flagellar brake protein YcgR
LTDDDRDSRDRPERRKHPRFSLKKDLEAVDRISSETKGRVVDLSEGGIGLRYESEFEMEADWEEVEVVDPDNGDTLLRASCEKVYDMPVVANGPYAGVFNLRRAAVRFTDLSNEQQNQLDLILHQFTSGRS